jgi:hypothetical protein
VTKLWVLPPLLAIATCAAARPARPPILPWWLASGNDVSARLELRQRVALVGSHLRICRILVSRSDVPLVLNKVSLGSGTRGQLTSFFFTRGGAFIERVGVMWGHGAWIPPIIPSDAADIRPFDILGKADSREDCELKTPPRTDEFQVISSYQSDLDAVSVPETLRRGHLLVVHGDYVLSNICVVRMWNRSVRCTARRAWRVEKR